MACSRRAVIERGQTSYGAYVPDLPGCVAVGESLAEVETLIREAIEFHVEGLRGGQQHRIPTHRSSVSPEVRESAPTMPRVIFCVA